MGQIVCFKHPKYDAATPPDLSCRLCCSQYIKRVTENQKKMKKDNGFKAYRRLTEKLRHAKMLAESGSKS